MRQVKRKALEEHKTFTRVVEDALSAWVQASPVKKRKVRLPTSGSGGLLPGIDISNSADLLDRMDGLS